MTRAVAAVELTLIGGPTVHLTYAGVSILTDPTFDPPGDYPGAFTLHKLTGPALSVEEVGPVDLVLLSHDHHADNLDTLGRALLANVPTVISTPAAASRDPHVRGYAPWTTVSHDAPHGGTISIETVPAEHGPPDGGPATADVTGFVLRADGLPTIYVSGDNASVPVVAEIARRTGPIDVAILFAGAANVGRFGDTDVTLNARTAIEAAKALGEALIVPVHTEGWAHFSETTDRLARMFHYAGLSDRLLVPHRGVRLSFPPATG